MSEAPPSLAARNAAIHAAEARFRAGAASIVSLVLRRAHGGDPVCLKLCLERALPAGRIPPPLALAPDLITVAPRGPGGILTAGA